MIALLFIAIQASCGIFQLLDTNYVLIQAYVFLFTESTSGDNTRSIINQSQMGEQEQVSAVMEEEKVIKEEELEVVCICMRFILAFHICIHDNYWQ